MGELWLVQIAMIDLHLFVVVVAVFDYNKYQIA